MSHKLTHGSKTRLVTYQHHFLWMYRRHTDTHSKLEKYRASEVAHPSSPTASACSSLGPSNSILADYGIATSDDEDNTSSVQSITDEKAAYLTSPCAAKGTGTLEFWSVRIWWHRIFMD